MDKHMQAQASEGMNASSEGSSEGRTAKGQEQDDGVEEDAEVESRPLSPIDRQYTATPPDVPRRVHILGTGSIGKLVAHSLRGIPNPPPVSLLFHRYKLLKAWEQSNKSITIQDGDFKVLRKGFDVELQPEVRTQHGVELLEAGPEVYDIRDETSLPAHEAAKVLEVWKQEYQNESPEDGREPTESEKEAARIGRANYYTKPDKSKAVDAISNEPIYNLIVAMKAAGTIPALSAIKHRLSSKSTICFLQNGMGIVDDVNKALFPDQSNRPTYVQGILTHGVNAPPELRESQPFFAIHAGRGTIALGLVTPRDDAAPQAASQSSESSRNTDESSNSRPDEISPGARYLIRTLTRTPVLCAAAFTPTELLQQQLEKLAVNSVLNPMTSLLDCRNGQILYTFPLTRTFRLLLAETSLVIRSLPELKGIPNIETRFSAARLEVLVVKVAEKTGENVSSMLADVRAGRKTEIEWINGYIVKRGEEIGISCVVNYAVMQMVMGKQLISSREWGDTIPVAEDLLKGD